MSKLTFLTYLNGVNGGTHRNRNLVNTKEAVELGRYFRSELNMKLPME